MRNLILISFLILLFFSACKTAGYKEDFLLAENERTEIMRSFILTQDAWNQGNLEQFMEGYWVSDSLVFVGSKGPTYGYDSTLESYRRGYPDTVVMGRLKFDVIDLRKIDTRTALMVGKFYLTRTIGDLQGYYTLVWQKINDKWVIISDHSSGDPVEGS